MVNAKVFVYLKGLGLYAGEIHQYNTDGRLATVGAGKYFIPTVSSIPLQMNVTILKDSDNVHAVYSSKVRHVCSLLHLAVIRDCVVTVSQEEPNNNSLTSLVV